MLPGGVQSNDAGTALPNRRLFLCSSIRSLTPPPPAARATAGGTMPVASSLQKMLGAPALLLPMGQVRADKQRGCALAMPLLLAQGRRPGLSTACSP